MKKQNKTPFAVLTTSIARNVAQGLFKMNLASITAKYWWITLRRDMVFLIRGKKGLPANAPRYVYEKRQLAQINEWNQFMNNQLTANERKHLAAVKNLPCGVCGSQQGSEAHHIEQHLQYTCIPLCADCHRGSFNGIHGQKRIWKVTKKTELTVLNDTIKKLMNR